MSDASRPGDVSRTSIARAIDEAVAGVVAGDRVRPIVRAALAASGAREIPEDAATLRPVVRALVAEIEGMVGADAAQLVSGELEALLRVLTRIEALAEGGAARSGSVPRETHRASTAPAIAPELVLVVSTAPDLGSRLRHLLGGATDVAVAGSMAGLRFQMLRARPLRPVVVIDGRVTMVDVPVGHSLASVQGAAALVVWGDHARADAWAWTAPDRVVRCSDEVELSDLACLLRSSLARVA